MIIYSTGCWPSSVFTNSVNMELARDDGDDGVPPS